MRRFPFERDGGGEGHIVDGIPLAPRVGFRVPSPVGVAAEGDEIAFRDAIKSVGLGDGLDGDAVNDKFLPLGRTAAGSGRLIVGRGGGVRAESDMFRQQRGGGIEYGDTIRFRDGLHGFHGGLQSSGQHLGGIGLRSGMADEQEEQDEGAHAASMLDTERKDNLGSREACGPCGAGEGGVCDGGLYPKRRRDLTVPLFLVIISSRTVDRPREGCLKSAGVRSTTGGISMRCHRMRLHFLKSILVSRKSLKFEFRTPGQPALLSLSFGNFYWQKV